MNGIDPYDVSPDVLRVVADVVDALQEQDVAIYSVEYDSDPRNVRREPVYVEAVTEYDGDPVSPETPESDFPAVLDIDSDHGEAEVYVESAPHIDFSGPGSTATWVLNVVVTLEGEGL